MVKNGKYVRLSFFQLSHSALKYIRASLLIVSGELLVLTFVFTLMLNGRVLMLTEWELVCSLGVFPTQPETGMSNDSSKATGRSWKSFSRLGSDLW